MRRRTGIGIACAAAAAAGALWLLARGAADDPLALSPQIRIEELSADLAGGFAPDAVVSERAEARVRAARLKPGGAFLDTRGGARPALVAPPPAVLRFRLRVPEDAVLAFGIGVQGEGRRQPGASGVRFAVAVDGREAFARTVNPAATRHDRCWFDERVALPAAPGRETEIVLSTEAEHPGAPLAGLAGWSKLRVVRERLRDRQPARPEAPSVLVLLVDTLRADRLGCYGATPSPTPTLDRLAADGLLFERVTAQSSWTMPAVATLFTGLHPRSHGVVGEWPEDPSRGSFLPPGLRTLAEHALEGGITTVAVTANPLVSPDTNLARGFESFAEFGWDDPRRRWAAAAEVNARFVAWLSRNRGERFLAYLHYMEPHDPYAPPADLRPAAPAGLRPRVARGDIEAIARRINRGEEPPLPPAEVAHLRTLYDGEIRSWDRELAALLAAIDALGVRDTTRIVVTADHGEEFQEHGRLRHRLHLYDESLHVPLVLAGPGLPRGRVAEPVQGIDFFPTVAALLDLPVPAGLAGVNLLGTRSPRPAVSETHQGLGPDGGTVYLVALRTPAWKLISTPALGRVELYDLVRDPAERNDRYGVAPEGAALAAELARWQAAAPPPPTATAEPAGLRPKLRALGYVD